MPCDQFCCCLLESSLKLLLKPLLHVVEQIEDPSLVRISVRVLEDLERVEGSVGTALGAAELGGILGSLRNTTVELTTPQ